MQEQNADNNGERKPVPWVSGKPLTIDIAAEPGHPQTRNPPIVTVTTCTVRLVRGPLHT
jgi:hypothetical protein